MNFVKITGSWLVLMAVFGLVLGTTTISNAGATDSTQANAGFALTSGPNYDRNSTLLKDVNGTFWMFFARTVDPCDPTTGCHQDNTSYNIFYMNSTDNQSWSTPVQLSDRTAAAIPADFYGRTIAATQDSTGKIYVFWASGGSTQAFYYYTFNNGTWSGANKSPENIYFNIEAVATKDGNITVFYEDGSGPNNGVWNLSLSNGVWSAPELVAPNLSIPKVIVDNTKFRVVMVNGTTGAVYITSALTNSTNRVWSTPVPVVTPQGNVTNWDPMILKVGRNYNVFYAPDFGNSTITESSVQRIEWKQSTDPEDWSAPSQVVTTGTSGTHNWWDYWPEATNFGNKIYLTYTSEMNCTQTGCGRGPGHIYLKVLGKF